MKVGGSRYGFAWYVLGLVLADIAPVAFALDTGSEHLNTQEPARPDLLSGKPPETFVLPPVVVAPGAATADAGSERQVLRRLVFHGNAVISTEELEGVAQPWLGKPVGAADIEALRIELSRHYVKRGYVNSGALLKGPGVTKEGVLEFEIVEGHIAAVRVGGLAGLDDAYVKQKLVPDPAAPLNIDSLRERFQLLLDDPLFVRMSSRISPGPSLGEAILDIDAERAKPYQLVWQINNYRPPSIGETAFGLSGWMRNLTGRGDVLEGSVRAPAEGSESPSGNVSWRIPLTYFGTSLLLQTDRGQSSVQEEPLSTVGVRSVMDSWEAGMSQVLYESLRHRFAVGISHVDRKNQTWLGGERFSFVAGEPNGITRVTTTRIWQEYTYRSEQQVLALRSTYSQSHNNLIHVAGLPPSPQPDSSYGVWLGQLQYVDKLTDAGTQLLLRATAQETSHRLLSMDGMSIGGVGTVRGFRENQLIADRGYVANLELDVPVELSAGSPIKVNLVPFIDYGEGGNNGGPTSAISSAGLAMRSRWGAFALDFALAGRIGRSARVQLGRGTWQDSGVNFQLSYDLSSK